MIRFILFASLMPWLFAGCDCGSTHAPDATVEHDADAVDAAGPDATAAPDAGGDASMEGSAGDAGGDAGGEDIGCDGTLLSIMPAWQAAICEGYLLCNGGPGSYVYETTAWAGSYEDCMRVGSWAARNLWRWAREGPPFGPRRVDCSLAAECLEATRSVCPDYPPQASRVAMGQGYPNPCTDMWLAPDGIDTGSRCELTTDCPPSDYCDFDTYTCVPRLTAGAECRYDSQCLYEGEGDFAACIASTGTCGGGRQLADGGEGDPCSEVGVVDGVADYVQCAPGLGCDFSIDPPTCTPPSPAGGRCQWHGLGPYCELGTVCLYGDTCAPFTYGAEGDPCTPSGDETWCDPRVPLVCSGGECTPLGDGSAGAPCGIYFNQCDYGLRCDIPSGVCVTR